MKVEMEFIEFTAVFSAEAIGEYRDEIENKIQECIPMCECGLNDLIHGDLIIK